MLTIIPEKRVWEMSHSELARHEDDCGYTMGSKNRLTASRSNLSAKYGMPYQDIPVWQMSLHEYMDGALSAKTPYGRGYLKDAAKDDYASYVEDAVAAGENVPQANISQAVEIRQEENEKERCAKEESERRTSTMRPLIAAMNELVKKGIVIMDCIGILSEKWHTSDGEYQFDTRRIGGGFAAPGAFTTGTFTQGETVIYTGDKFSARQEAYTTILGIYS